MASAQPRTGGPSSSHPVVKPGHVSSSKHHSSRDDDKRKHSSVPARAVDAAPPKEPSKGLRRQTAFLSTIRFRNELPEVPVEPKFLKLPFNKDKLCSYQVTTLEKNFKHDLVVEPDLGIPIQLMNFDIWDPKKYPQELHPADAALLEDDDLAPADGKPGSKRAPGTTPAPVERARIDRGWLLATSYISNDTGDRSAKLDRGLNEKRYKSMKAREQLAAQELGDVDERTTRVRLIEETFRKAKEPPVHATNPSLTAVEVYPVLPFVERWGDFYANLVFDAHPLADSEVYGKLPPQATDRLATRAILSFHDPEKDVPLELKVGKEKSLQLMLPRPAEVDDDSADEMEFNWVRDYRYQVKPGPADRNTFCFVFDSDGVRYLPMRKRMMMNKLKAKDGKNLGEEVADPPPSRVGSEGRTPLGGFLIHPLDALI
eukprot:jgi/Mesvir1/27291/Mv07124-RA.1